MTEAAEACIRSHSVLCCGMLTNVVTISQVLQTDEGPTMICVPCYVQLVHHYKLRIRCLSLRKNFRLNQSVLLAQINAFRGKELVRLYGVAGRL